MLEAFHRKETVKQGESNPTLSADEGAKGVNAGISCSAKKVQRELLFNEDPQDMDMGIAQDQVSNLALQENRESKEVEMLDKVGVSLDKGNNRRCEAMEQLSGPEAQESAIVAKTTQEGFKFGTQGVEEDFDLSEIKESLEENEIINEKQAEKEVLGKEGGEKQQSVKKKLFTANAIFVGRTTKKRMVQAIISPRKKVVAGKDSGPEEVKDTSRLRAEPGNGNASLV